MAMLREFRVIIMNAGAHRMPMAAYQQKMQQVGIVVRDFLQQNPNGAAVFRTTVPGFSGCENTRSARPHASLATAEAYLQAHPFYDQHEFVPVANRIAIAEMERVGGRVVDVYASSILRLDDRAGTQTYHGGIDCLHYRLPLLQTSLLAWARMLGESLLGSPQLA
jgi:hypothetical protein